MSETITRACGHEVQFAPQGDGYDDGRRAKLKRKRCHECGLKANEENNRQQALLKPSGKIKKGAEVKMLPVGTVITLERGPESWHGSLSAEGLTIAAQMNGAMGIVQKLARKWLQQKGAGLICRVQE